MFFSNRGFSFVTFKFVEAHKGDLEDSNKNIDVSNGTMQFLVALEIIFFFRLLKGYTSLLWKIIVWNLYSFFHM